MIPTVEQVEAAAAFWTDALLSGNRYVPAEYVSPKNVARFGQRLRQLLQFRGDTPFADVFQRHLLRASDCFVLYTNENLPVGLLNEAATGLRHLEMLAFPCNVQFILWADGRVESR